MRHGAFVIHHCVMFNVKMPTPLSVVDEYVNYIRSIKYKYIEPCFVDISTLIGKEIRI